jgi:hypothetical protein
MSSEGAGNNVRAEAERHIADHSLGEAARIGRLSRIREFVLGAQDGLLVPLGVVTGMAAAHPARSLIVVAGLAEAVAGAISMGGGSYLASEAEEQLYVSEIAAEGREIDEFPERETDELTIVLEREGLSREQAEMVAHGLASNPNVFLRTKVEKELGISYPTVRGKLDEIISTLGYSAQKKPEVDKKKIISLLEKGEITAEKAIQLLKEGEV